MFIEASVAPATASASAERRLPGLAAVNNLMAQHHTLFQFDDKLQLGARPRRTRPALQRNAHPPPPLSGEPARAGRE
jgi:hypothetical protein